MLIYKPYERFSLLVSLKPVSPQGHNVSIKQWFQSETEYNVDPYNRSEALNRYYGKSKTSTGTFQTVTYPDVLFYVETI